MSRLIDADALIDKYGDWYTEEGNEEGYIGTIKGIVNKMPTIEERKKGKWEPHPNKEFREWDVCTACGTGCKRREYEKNPDGREWVTEFNYLFCPNCGALMGGTT